MNLVWTQTRADCQRHQRASYTVSGGLKPGLRDFNAADVSIADVRWMKLDIARVVAVGNWVERPDLRKVDEIGFADLIPGSGHGPGGYVNVARIEVYGKSVKR